MKGIDIAQWIRTNSHNGKVPVVILEDEGKNDTNDENLFWKYLGGKPATIRSAAEGGDDYNHE